MKRTKRILSLFLCTALILNSVLPTSMAFASTDITNQEVIEESVVEEQTEVEDISQEEIVENLEPLIEEKVNNIINLIDSEKSNVEEILTLLLGSDYFFDILKAIEDKEKLVMLYEKMSNKEMYKFGEYIKFAVLEDISKYSTDISEEEVKKLHVKASFYALHIYREFLIQEDKISRNVYVALTESEKELLNSEAKEEYFDYRKSGLNEEELLICMDGSSYFTYLESKTTVSFDDILNNISKISADPLKNAETLKTFEVYLLKTFGFEVASIAHSLGSISIADFDSFDEKAKDKAYFSVDILEKERKTNFEESFPKVVVVTTEEGKRVVMPAKWKAIEDVEKETEMNFFAYELDLQSGYKLSETLKTQYDSQSILIPYVTVEVLSNDHYEHDIGIQQMESEYPLSDLDNGKWKKLSDKKLDEYFYNNNDSDMYEFYTSLSSEEQTELLKRDTALIKNVKAYLNDGTTNTRELPYYEFLQNGLAAYPPKLRYAGMPYSTGHSFYRFEDKEMGYQVTYKVSYAIEEANNSFYDAYEIYCDDGSGYLTLRQTASTSGTAIRRMYNGNQVLWVKSSGSWAYVICNGDQGWCLKQYLVSLGVRQPSADNQNTYRITQVMVSNTSGNFSGFTGFNNVTFLSDDDSVYGKLKQANTTADYGLGSAVVNGSTVYKCSWYGVFVLHINGVIKPAGTTATYYAENNTAAVWGRLDYRSYTWQGDAASTVDATVRNVDYPDQLEAQLYYINAGMYDVSELTPQAPRYATLVYSVTHYNSSNNYQALAYLNANSGLPAGYKRLHYIEATGTQYIDTGYKPVSENLNFRFDFDQDILGGGQALVGSEYNGSSRQWPITIYGGNGSFSHYVGNTSYIASISSSAGTKHNYQVRANNGNLNVYFDQQLTQTTYTGSLLKGYNIYLFANNIDGTASQFAKAKMYNFQIYDNDVLVRDMVPCTNSSDVVGMYDLVEGKFYTNAGTGNFNTHIYGYRISLPAPIRAGYTFLGWHVDGAGTMANDGVSGSSEQRNSQFESGIPTNVAVYNNSGNGNVTLTRIATTSSTGNPTGSGYIGKLSVNPTGVTPGNGGFYNNTQTKAGRTYIHQFVAKIPKGLTVNQARNSAGTGAIDYWLTSREGTGEWETYAYATRCGTSGTFSTMGHVYLTGATASFEWYLASTKVTDVTNILNNQIATYESSSAVSLYNNSGNGNVVHSLIADSTEPTGTGYSLQIAVNGTASPGNGGFYQLQYAKAGHTYVHHFWGKFPKGVTLEATGNYGGEHENVKWYTPKVGTGEWEEYAYETSWRKSFTSSNPNFGHVYMLGGTAPFNAYLGYSQIYDITSSAYIYGQANATINAQWKANSYAVIYDGNGATGGATETSIHTYDEEKTLTENGFTKTGYTFNGWNTAADGSGTSYTDMQTVLNLAEGGNITLYAQWVDTPTTHTVTIYHYTQNADGTYSQASREVKSLTSGLKTAQSYIKSTYDDGTSYNYSHATVDGVDGEEVTTFRVPTQRTLYLFYDRVTYKVTLTKGTGISAVTGAGTYRWGESVSVGRTVATGYTWKTWSGYRTSTAGTVSFAMPKQNVSMTATATINNYTITYNSNLGLPSGYKIVSYLESSGTQYLDLGLTTNQNTRLVVKGYYTGAYSLYGAGKAFTNFTANSSGGYFYFNDYAGGNSTPVDYSSTAHVFEQDKNYAKVDDSLVHTFTAASFTSPGNLFLFGRNDNAGALNDAGGTVRIYGAEVYDNGTLVRNLIPCVNTSGTAGMYDTVNSVFYTNAGTGSFTVPESYRTSYNVTSLAYTLPTPTALGYTFGGWYSNSSLTTKVTSYAKGTTGNKTLYAKWTPITYKVAYNGNGNTSGNTSTVTHTYDTAKEISGNIFGKTGYTFTGWNTKADGTGIPYSAGQSVINLSATSGKQIILYAQWKINSYDLKIDPNGGYRASDNSTAVITVTKEYGATESISERKRTGYTLTGYTMKNTDNDSTSDIGGATFTFNSSTKVGTFVQGSKPITLTAQWTPNIYKATLDNQGATTAGTPAYWYQYKTTKVINGETVYYYTDAACSTPLSGYTITKPTKTGYTFGGYFTGTNGSGTQYVNANGQCINNLYSAVANDITLYAYWTPNTYKVTLDNQGATTAGTPAYWYQYKTSKVINNATVYYYTNNICTTPLSGSKITVPTKTGYTFGGYYTAANGGGTQYINANGGCINNIYSNVAKDTTLYAKWTPNTLTVYYNANGGTVGSADHYIDDAKDIRLKSNDAKSSQAWTYNSAKSNGLVDASFYSLTKPGYTFAGWNTKADGSGTTFADSDATIVPTDLNANISNGNCTVTLYAKWTANEYTVSYDANGGSGTMTTDKIKYNEPYTAKENAFTPPRGHHFSHWNEKADDSGSSWAGYIGVPWTWTYTKNITLYAQWSPDSYSIEYDANGGSGTMTSHSITYGSTVKIKDNTFTAPTGYQFAGWTTKSDGTNDGHGWFNASTLAGWTGKWSYINGQYGISSNKLKLYAMWKPVTVTVTLNPNGGSGGTESVEATYNSVLPDITLPTYKGHIFKGYFADDRQTNLTSSVSKWSSTARVDFKQTGNPWKLTTDGDKGRQFKAVITVVDSSIANPPTIQFNDKTLDSSFYKREAITNGWKYTVDFEITQAMVSASGSTPYDTGYRFIDFEGTTTSTTVTVQSASVGGYMYYNTSGKGVLVSDFATDSTLYAHWDPKTFTIEYDANGGSGTMTSHSIVYGNTVKIKDNTFTAPTGYHFAGWTTNSDGTDDNSGWYNKSTLLGWTGKWLYDNGQYGIVNDKLKLYAMWELNEYTATFDANGGTIANPQTIKKKFGEALGELPTTSRTGYTFNGWFEGTKRDITIAASSSNGNCVAVLKEITPGTTYTVSIDSAKLTAGTATKFVTLMYDFTTPKVYAESHNSFGDDISFIMTCPSTADPTHDIRIIIYAGVNGQTANNAVKYEGIRAGAKISPETTMPLNGATYYAQWTQNVASYKVNHYQMGTDGKYSTTATSSQTLQGTPDGSITLADLANTYDGFKYKEGKVGTTTATTTTIKADGSTVINLYYERNSYTVKASPGTGVSGTTGGGTFYWGASVTVNATVANGYSWKNWTGTGVSASTSQEYTFTMPKANVTLTANATPNTYYVTYDANGGTGAPAKQSFLFNSNDPLSSTKPTREGYTFVNWKASHTDQYFNPGDAIPSGWGSFTLVAQWKINNYTNTIQHWMWGFVNNEGNNSDKSAFKIKDTTFNANYNASNVMDASKATTIPNGFYLKDKFATNATGTWVATHNLGETIVQPAKAIQFEYDYYLNTYSISYDLNGGTVASANPSSYNVLYGLTFNNPTKRGYIFDGWFVGNVKDITLNASTGNYNYTRVQAAKPGETYYISMDKAEVTSGTATKFATLVYDFTSSKSLASAQVSFGSNLEYAITCPSTADPTHDIRIIIYAGINGQTANNAVKYTGVSIGEKATGINEGCNATFTSSDDMYTKLAARTTGNKRVVAKWTPEKFTVNYHSNGGSGTIPSTTLNYGDPITINDNTGTNKFVKNGYKFIGWTTIKPTTHQGSDDGFGWKGSGTWDYVNGTAGIANNELNLYARWQPITYSIKYNANNGAGTMNNSSHTYNNEVVNWSKQYDSHEGNRGEYLNTGIDLAPVIDSQGVGTYIVEFDAKAATAGNMQVYMQNGSEARYSMSKSFGITTDWKHYRFEVNVSLQNSSLTQSLLAFYGVYDSGCFPHVKNIEFTKVNETLTANAFSRNGYTFNGWNTKADGTGTAYTNSQGIKNLTTTDGATINLYAQWKANTYEVKFNGNGSTSGTMSNQSFTYDVAQNLTANAFTRKYTVTYEYNNSASNTTADATATFNGWATSANGNKVYNDKAEVKNLATSGTYNLYANWTLGKVTLPTPTKTGYTFKNWNTKADGTGTSYNAGAEFTPTANTTLYAQWDANVYAVTYDNQGADIQSGTEKSYYKYMTYKTINGYNYSQFKESTLVNVFENDNIVVPKKNGYTFKGYFSEKNGGGTQYVLDNGQFTNQLYKTIGPHTLYAHWVANTLTVYYNANGGSVTSENHISDASNNILNKASGNKASQIWTYNEPNEYGLINASYYGLEKTGYTFQGWTLSANGSGTLYDELDASIVPTDITANIKNGNTSVTMYAKWTPNTYEVKFNGNGSTSGTMNNQKFTYDVSQNLTANAFNRAGYTFVNWNTKADGSGTTYSNNANVKNLVTSGTITLYAQWKANTDTPYKVQHWQENIGADASKHDETNYTLKDTDNLKGTTDTKVKPQVKTYEGFTSPSVQEVVIKGDGSTVVNYYYTRNSYKLDLTAGTGISTVTGAGTYEYGQSVSIDATVKAGYTWKNWTGSGVSASTTKNYKFNMPANAVSLTANATANTYTLTLDKQNGEGGVDALYEVYDTKFYTDTVNQTSVSKITVPTRTGYTFGGYYTATNGGGNVIVDANGNIKVANNYFLSDVTIYAKWTPIVYSITYNSNRGLPAGYKILSYIESTGTQYIDTGYKPTSEDLKVYIEFSQDTSKSAQSLFGTEDNKSSSTRQWSIVPHGGAGAYSHYVGNSPSRQSMTASVGTKHTYLVHADNGVLQSNVDGNISRTTYTGELCKKYNIYIFANNIDGNAGQFATNKLYGFKIYDNGALVRNMIPCENASGVAGLYDTVGGKFYTNAGSGTFKVSETYVNTYTIEDAVSIPSPSKVGYTFGGWYENASFTGNKVTSYAKGTYGDKTLYAKWTANTYTVTYNGNTNTGGATSVSNHTYDSMKALNANGFTKKGYSFVEWNTRADGKGMSYTDKEVVENLTDVNGGNVTLYAQWKANKYVVIYDGNGATSGKMANSEFTYDKEGKLSKNEYVKKEHYFVGWNTKRDGSGESYEDEATIKNLAESGTVTLYAQWKLNAGTLLTHGIYHTEQWDKNREHFNTKVDSVIDRDVDVFWSGEKFIVKAEFLYERNTELNVDALIKEVRITNANHLDGSDYVVLFDDYLDNKEYMNDLAAKDGKYILTQTSYVWGDDMIARWGGNAPHELEFAFTFVDGSTKYVYVKVDNTKPFYALHRVK